MKKLTGRVAVVTGAAGGIGRATSIALAQAGCDLAISDVNEAALEETAAAIRQLGRRVCAHQVDVADKARMLAYVEEVTAEYGRVNILVNNAGVTVTKTFEDHSIADFEWLFGINFWGVVYGCKFFLPHLQASDEAHIVNISSLFGIVGIPKQSSYCASKYAVRGFTESLCCELEASNIGVTSVHPGAVDTNIARNARGADERDRERSSKMLEKGVSPSHAAGRILAAIKGNKKRLLITREAYAIDWLKRASPDMTQAIIGAVGRFRQ